ncbi:M20 family metallopeptidase [Mycolicibacterium mageritense]|uniref:Succinyl-diaminopimelate desuccinylase n=1 Tax=Mycolicibacterium mageritense TaxID=53462 RepID=A0AAI8TQJ1_MYCME|nr:M20 family metallopeptidase [Mycolicibacterium mageritense]BDY26702.1 putative succinyl-diaminopimelate desuccinylase [Mycolicibacterium mageritense]
MSTESPVIPDVVELLHDMVAIDTTNPGGDEAGAADLLAGLFARHGLDTAVDQFDPEHANIAATASFGTGGPTIVLNSHLDVVPAVGDWTTPAFAPEIRDGRMYGRGSADAKGSLAAMAVAVLRLVRADDTDGFCGTIKYTAVGDEEVGSRGARHLLASADGIDGAIIGEPTGLRLLSAHKGSVRPVIEIKGRAAHAAAPEKGLNAIHAAAPLLALLNDYAAELSTRVHPLTGAPTAVPVLIHGGEAPNAVPERCRITVDRRLVPGETASTALFEIESLLAKFNADQAPFTATIAECAPSTGGPSQTPDTSPFVATCRKALEDVHADSSLGGLIVNCDMTHFRAAGIPTVVIGPGELEAMHVCDESIQLDELRRAVDVYEAILRRFMTP